MLQISDTDPDLLKALLILIMDDEDISERLVGPIVEVLEVTFSVAGDTMDRCIDPVEGARFFIGEEADDLLEVTEGDFDDLEPEQEATVFGLEGNDGCFQAEIIFALEPDDDSMES